MNQQPGSLIKSNPSTEPRSIYSRDHLLMNCLTLKGGFGRRAEPFNASSILLNTNFRRTQALTGPLGFSTTNNSPDFFAFADFRGGKRECSRICVVGTRPPSEFRFTAGPISVHSTAASQGKLP
ncbi:hypothetical protein QQP08_007989 [Theobroma cacao]|nr:hypothetical protein QQP08_007989 [Theobroma cacao]